MTFDAETMRELTELLSRRDAGNRKLETELRREAALERDADFIARVAAAVQRLEHDGTALPITQELRARLAPEAPAQQQTRQAAPQQQTQTRAGAAVSAMTQLYAALRPPAPATPPPWEQAPQPLGDRLRAFEARKAETAAANQVKAAQVAGECAMIALDALSPTPGGATLARVRDAAQGDPGGIQAVVEGMKPGGRFAELRTAFNTALADRGFASAYDRAVQGVTAYGQARLKAGDVDQFEGMDRAIGQASEALPGRKPSKSVQDEIAEKAHQVAEFLKAAVLRIGAAISSAPAPNPAASPKLAMTL